MACCMSRSSPTKGRPTNPTHVSAREKTCLVFIHIFMLLCTSFLFRKLLGVALLEKKGDVPHGRFHRSQTAGPGYGDIPDKSSFGFARRSRRDTLGKFLSVHPRVTWVGQATQPSSRQKLFFPKFNRQGLHVSPEHRVPDRLNCASWDRVPHLGP